MEISSKEVGVGLRRGSRNKHKTIIRYEQSLSTNSLLFKNNYFQLFKRAGKRTINNSDLQGDKSAHIFLPLPLRSLFLSTAQPTDQGSVVVVVVVVVVGFRGTVFFQISHLHSKGVHSEKTILHNPEVHFFGVHSGKKSFLQNGCIFIEHFCSKLVYLQKTFLQNGCIQKKTFPQNGCSHRKLLIKN